MLPNVDKVQKDKALCWQKGYFPEDKLLQVLFYGNFIVASTFL